MKKSSFSCLEIGILKSRNSFLPCIFNFSFVLKHENETSKKTFFSTALIIESVKLYSLFSPILPIFSVTSIATSLTKQPLVKAKTNKNETRKEAQKDKER